VLYHVTGRWVKVPQKSSDGASLWEEKATLDCLITKNRPEVGLQRAGRFIHHLQSEYPFLPLTASPPEKQPQTQKCCETQGNN
jgi:hypothetical protein